MPVISKLPEKQFSDDLSNQKQPVLSANRRLPSFNRVHRLLHTLCASISKALTRKVKVGDLVKFAAEQVGGKASRNLHSTNRVRGYAIHPTTAGAANLKIKV
ncbi:TPA: hypothetical protein ACQUJH_001095 [Neisseria cinerea]